MKNEAYLEHYFLNHGVGVFPNQEERIALAMAEYASDWCKADNWDLCLAKRQQFLDAWAEELGTFSRNLCTMENVTTAVSTLIGALPDVLISDRTILIAEDCFPSLHFLLNGLQERYGFTLRTVKKGAGPYVSEDDFVEAWDETVGLALLTWVSSTTSHRIDIGRLVKHGREMGSLICADLTQGAGIIPINVESVDIDFAITTSLKWACGSPGAGVIYIREEQLENCTPELRGWFSQDDPFRWKLDQFRYADDAERFQNGTPAILACYASIPGFEWRKDTGREAILTKNRELTARLVERGEEQGWNILTPLSPSKRGGSIMLEMPKAIDQSKLMQKLATMHFTVDQRGSILRLSPGFTTSGDALEELCDELDLAGMKE